MEVTEYTHEELYRAAGQLDAEPENYHGDYGTWSGVLDVILDRARKGREPLWAPGDVVIDADGRELKLASTRRWQAFGYSEPLPFDAATRPLRLIYSKKGEQELARRIESDNRARDDGAPI